MATLHEAMRSAFDRRRIGAALALAALSAPDARAAELCDALSELHATGDGHQQAIYLQLGFIDAPKSPKKSVDSLVAELIARELVEECSFEELMPIGAQPGARSLGRAGLRIELIQSSPDEGGTYDKAYSDQLRAEFTARLASANYFIYLGHSRHGLGADLHSRVERYGQIIPIYSPRFFDAFAPRLQGVGIIGCLSGRYLPISKAQIRFSVQDNFVTLSSESVLHDLSSAILKIAP